MAREVISVANHKGEISLINLDHVSMATVPDKGADNYTVNVHFQGNHIPMLTLRGDEARKFVAAFQPKD